MLQLAPQPVPDKGHIVPLDLLEKNGYEVGDKGSQELTGPLVWTGDDFKTHQSYTLQLEECDLVEISKALASFKSLGRGEDKIEPAQFPLPTLGPHLSECARVIHQGQGFLVIRGLHEREFTTEDGIMVYLGIASYIADQRGQQDRKGNMLSHITSSKTWTVPVHQRHGIHSEKPLPFHNDMGCDLLALHARHSAREGGFTYLASACTVYNTLVGEEPEVVKTLLTPNWPVQISGRDASYYLAPALAFEQGRLMSSMDPGRFGPHPSSDALNVPELTFAQKYALERVSEVARRVELRLRLETGDLLFFNNWALLHRRDSYTDDSETSRHLVRLWLRNSKLGWAIPETMLPPWMAAYQPQVPVARIYAHCPSAEYKRPKYSAGSAAFIIEDSDDEH